MIGRAAPALRRPDRWFYVGIASAAILTIFSGFAPSFYLRTATMPRLAPGVVAHGILFSGWVVLFFVQALLVALGRTGLHGRLGLVSAAIGAVMVVTAPPMAVALARRGAPPGDPLAFLLIILVDLFLFGLFLAAGIYHRRRSEVHKRLMLLAVVTLLPPAISRWPLAVTHPAVIPGVLLLFLAAAPIYDLLAQRRPHPVSVWGGLGVLLSVPVRFAVAHTAAWHHLASWLVR